MAITQAGAENWSVSCLLGIGGCNPCFSLFHHVRSQSLFSRGAVVFEADYMGCVCSKQDCNVERGNALS